MTAENVEIARSAYDAFNRRGVEGIIDFLDPQIEWRAWERFSRDDHVDHGHEGARRVLAVYEENISELRVDPHDFIDAGEHVVVPFRLHGRARGSGEAVEYELVHVWTLPADGERKATRVVVYDSKDEALRSVGLATS
jgi:ketosteroid isomerase-like protein